MNIPRTIGESIAHIDPNTGDTIRARLSHEDALRKLSIAVENYTRAARRVAYSYASTIDENRRNARGAEIRLAEAQADAVVALSTPAMGESEFDRRSA